MVNVLIADRVKDSKKKACVTSNAAKNQSLKKLWHWRLGHPSGVVLESVPESHIEGMTPKLDGKPHNSIFAWMQNRLCHPAWGAKLMKNRIIWFTLTYSDLLNQSSFECQGID